MGFGSLSVHLLFEACSNPCIQATLENIDNSFPPHKKKESVYKPDKRSIFWGTTWKACFTWIITLTLLSRIGQDVNLRSLDI